MAHIDAGKTSLTENLLFKSGMTRTLGKVDSGDTITDTLEMEKKRGITIKETTTSLYWKDIKINILDTPGHYDFFSEVLRTLYVLDFVVLVISGVEGIQTQTDKIIRLLQEKEIPFIVFINKVDRIGFDHKKIVEDLRSRYKVDFVQMQCIDMDSMKISDCSENKEILEDNLLRISIYSPECLKYVEEKIKSIYELIEVLKKLFWMKRVYPIFFGSAKNDLGISELLDFIAEIANYFEKNKNLSLGKLSGIVYKIIHEKNKKLIYFRIYRGNISKFDILKIGENESLKIKNLYKIEKTKIIECNTVSEGDIGILLNVHNIKVGDIIGVLDERVRKVPVSEPCFHFALYPSDLRQKIELNQALEEIMLEDPSISFRSENDKFILKISGEIQKEYIMDRLISNYKINCLVGEIDVIIKETIREKAVGSIGIYKSKNFLNAGIKFEISPKERGSGVEYESEVSYGYLTKSFQNAVYEGVMIGVRSGLKGGELTDIKITLKGAIYDSCSSTPADFRKLSPEVIQKIISEIGTQILFPYMDISIRLNKSFCGVLTQEILLINGTIRNIEVLEETMEINCILESSRWNELIRRLNSITSGKFEYKIKRLIYE